VTNDPRPQIADLKTLNALIGTPIRTYRSSDVIGSLSRANASSFEIYCSRFFRIIAKRAACFAFILAKRF
jgi:hypothetical protein